MTAIAILLAASGPSRAAEPDATLEVVDLRNTPVQGLPPWFHVTVYRARGAGARQPLVIFVPQFATRIENGWFRSQAAFFTEAAMLPALAGDSDALFSSALAPPVWQQPPVNGFLASLPAR